MIETPIIQGFSYTWTEIFKRLYSAHYRRRQRDGGFLPRVGQEAWIPQTSLFFERDNGKDVILTIPNVHPGPMGEIGGVIFHLSLRGQFSEEMMVAHGCATHDYNLVSESEISKISKAINDTRSSLSWRDVPVLHEGCRLERSHSCSSVSGMFY